MINRIYIIEDKKEDMDKIVQKLNALSQEKNVAECQFEFIPLEGTIKDEYDGQYFCFYEENVIRHIEEAIQSEEMQEGHRMCILLDIYITRDDFSNKTSGNQTGADLAKKIYLNFKERIPIYIITDAPWFATKCDVIMGIDLSEQFIPKNALLRYELEEDIDALFNFYRNEKITNA